MTPVDTRRVSFEEAVASLRTLDVNELGLQADAMSRARFNHQAGYRRPHNVVLGDTIPAAGRDVRIVDVKVQSEAIYEALERCGDGWIEGLVTSDVHGLSLPRLRQAGLRRLLGSHCETFTGGQRRIRGEHPWEQALPVLRAAAEAGLRLHVDLLYGEDETPEQLVRQLLDVRQLQDDTGAVDALVPMPHNAKRTLETPGEITFGFDDMRLLSVARLVLDNVPHIQVPWLPFGLKAAQMGLVFGGDDVGPWCLDPGVTEEAHVATHLAMREEELLMAIRDAGRLPVLWKGQE